MKVEKRSLRRNTERERTTSEVEMHRVEWKNWVVAGWRGGEFRVECLCGGGCGVEIGVKVVNKWSISLIWVWMYRSG